MSFWKMGRFLRPASGPPQPAAAVVCGSPAAGVAGRVAAGRATSARRHSPVSVQPAAAGCGPNSGSRLRAVHGLRLSVQTFVGGAFAKFSVSSPPRRGNHAFNENNGMSFRNGQCFTNHKLPVPLYFLSYMHIDAAGRF
ncbi:MAG TPA: hypothetical protein VG796_23670 [Verrucomicrobiales bacterium]|nr:hypothetical protein [Verrucomicrobiales bacterium]